MNFRNHARTLAIASMFALAVTSNGIVQARGADAQVLGPTGVETPSGPGAPFQCAACAKFPGTLTFAQGYPNLQAQIVSTAMTCDQVYPNDPDACQEPRFTVNIRVTNVGSESSPATKLEWRCCIGQSGYLDGTRSVPALAPGQTENDSWQVRPYLVFPGLPPGSCDNFAIQLNPLGAPPHLGQDGIPSVQTALCNTLG